CVVRVSYLKTVAGFDLLARLLADQPRPRVLVIIPGLLFLSVNQYHRVWVEVFPYHDQLLARDRCHSYFGRRDCGEGVTELRAVERTTGRTPPRFVPTPPYHQRFSAG